MAPFERGDDRDLEIESWGSGYCPKCNVIYKWRAFQRGSRGRWARRDARCRECSGRLGPLGKVRIQKLIEACGERGIAELVAYEGGRHTKPIFD